MVYNTGSTQIYTCKKDVAKTKQKIAINTAHPKCLLENHTAENLQNGHWKRLPNKSYASSGAKRCAS